MKKLLIIFLTLFLIISCTGCALQSNPNADAEWQKAKIIGLWLNKAGTIELKFEGPETKSNTIPGYYCFFTTLDNSNKKKVLVNDILRYSFDINDSTLTLTPLEEEAGTETVKYKIAINSSGTKLTLIDKNGEKLNLYNISNRASQKLL